VRGELQSYLKDFSTRVQETVSVGAILAGRADDEP
jgi:hypothetical protein